MNNLVEINPLDLFINVIHHKGTGGMWCGGGSTGNGVTLHHKPSGKEITVDRHRSQHKNRHEALTILQDLLTEFKVGDIVYSSAGEFLLDKVGGICFLTNDEHPEGLQDYKTHISHTPEGYRYKTIKRKKEMIAVR